MRLDNAQKRAKRLQVAGKLLLATAFSLFFMGLSKCLNALTWPADPLWATICSLIHFPFKVFFSLFPAAHWLLDFAPQPTIAPLNSTGNCYTIFLFCMAMISQQILDDARRLAARIERIKKKVRGGGWKKEVRLNPEPVPPPGDIMNGEIRVRPRDQWHKRPPGILLLGICGVALLQIINLSFELI